MKSFDQIFKANRSWVRKKEMLDKDYFKKLAMGQQPKYLWIGCSDSRVPETEITGTEPGEIFVHRNIANLVNSNDPNVMSVLKYAVDYLKVKHIVVCGHYECGGVKAAIDNLHDEYLGDWIVDIKKTYKNHKKELKLYGDERTLAYRLSELSVVKQVEKLCDTAIVQNAWERGYCLFIHGWIFDITTGKLKTLMEINPDNLPDDILGAIGREKV